MRPDYPCRRESSKLILHTVRRSKHLQGGNKLPFKAALRALVRRPHVTDCCLTQCSISETSIGADDVPDPTHYSGRLWSTDQTSAMNPKPVVLMER